MPRDELTALAAPLSFDTVLVIGTKLRKIEPSSLAVPPLESAATVSCAGFRPLRLTGNVRMALAGLLGVEPEACGSFAVASITATMAMTSMLRCVMYREAPAIHNRKSVTCRGLP